MTSLEGVWGAWGGGGWKPPTSWLAEGVMTRERQSICAGKIRPMSTDSRWQVTAAVQEGRLCWQGGVSSSHSLNLRSHLDFWLAVFAKALCKNIYTIVKNNIYNIYFYTIWFCMDKKKSIPAIYRWLYTIISPGFYHPRGESVQNSHFVVQLNEVKPHSRRHIQCHYPKVLSSSNNQSPLALRQLKK